MFGHAATAVDAEGPVTMTGDAREMEAENLARVRETVQMVLRDWEWMTWDQLLADDVALSLRLDASAVNEAGGLGGVAGDLQVRGREEAKRVLSSIYGDLRSGLSVTSEMVSGYAAALLGNLAVSSTRENTAASSLPIVLYMAFNDEGEIEQLTVAALDLHPLVDAILAAAKGAPPAQTEPSTYVRSAIATAVEASATRAPR